MLNTQTKYRDLSGLTRVMMVLLSLNATWNVLMSWLYNERRLILEGQPISEADLQVNFDWQSMLTLPSLAFVILTPIVGVLWVHRAHRNLAALGATGLRYSPFMAWFSGLIPLLQFWMPYQAMRDLWRASHNPVYWMEARSTPLLPLWWICFLFTSIVGGYSVRLAFNVITWEDLQLTTQFQIASEISHFILCLLFFPMVRRIAAAQKSQRIEQELQGG